MKNGSPQLRSAKRSALQALDQWSEVPAVDSAKAVAQQSAVSEPSPEPLAATAVTPAYRGPGRPPKRLYDTQETLDPNRPWAIAAFSQQMPPLKSTTFRLPNELYLKLKWIGDTTFNQSMTDVVIAALEKEVALRLQERGISCANPSNQEPTN